MIESWLAEQLATIDPGLHLPSCWNEPGPAWTPVHDVLDGSEQAAAMLDAAIARTGIRLRTDVPWIAAAVLFQGWAGRLSSLYVAAMTHDQEMPDLRASCVDFRMSDEDRIQIGLREWVVIDRGNAWNALLYEHLGPVGEAIRERVRIARRLLDGSIAAALAGAVNRVAETTGEDIEALLGQPWSQPQQMQPYGRWLLDQENLTYARRTCCGYEQVPTGDRCHSCPFNWRMELAQS